MVDRRGGRSLSRMALAAIIFSIVVASAGCSDLGDGPSNGATETTPEQVTETVESTPEPATESPPATETPSEGTGTPAPETDAAGGGGGSGGSEGSNDLGTILLVGALAVFVLGFTVALLLRGRNKPAPTTGAGAVAPTPTDTPSEAEQVISLLHRNNGRMFQDVLEEELDWSPVHTQRILDGLVGTGDIELRTIDRGTLVLFAQPWDDSDEFPPTA
jgi:hypothetical protein